MNLKSFLIVSAVAAASVASAQVRITEWMYNGSEFVELTNVGGAAVDFSAYSFDDNSRTPGSVSLADFGMVGAGTSVILSESTAAAFRTQWGLSASVKVIGGNSNNLGRADEINIYNGSILVDRLTYDDQNLGGPQTSVASGNIALSKLGLNASGSAVKSVVGDSYGSFTSITGGFVANPGKYAPVPEPASMVALSLGALGLIRRRRQA